MKRPPAAVLAATPAARERVRAALQAAGLPLLELPDSEVRVVVAVSDGSEDVRGRVHEALAAAPGAVEVVLASGDGSRRAVRAAVEAGARGFVALDSLERSLAATVAAVAAGQTCVPAELGDQVERPLLSMREKQVLGMVVLGFANGEIAAKLVVAESTVKSHLNSAFRKLGVRSRQEASEAILDPANGLGTGILTIENRA